MTLVTVKTAELQGPALDWCVAKIEGRTTRIYLCPIGGHYAVAAQVLGGDLEHAWLPSLAWDQGGPLIERYGIEIFCNLSAEQAARFKDARPDWRACMNRGRSKHSFGVTPLLAACRAIVASQLGDTVQVPQELVQ